MATGLATAVPVQIASDRAAEQVVRRAIAQCDAHIRRVDVFMLD